MQLFVLSWSCFYQCSVNYSFQTSGCFSDDYRRNNGQRWERNESCCNNYLQSSDGIFAGSRIKPATSCSHVLAYRHVLFLTHPLSNVMTNQTKILQGLLVLLWGKMSVPCAERGLVQSHSQVNHTFWKTCQWLNLCLNCYSPGGGSSAMG